MIPSCRGHGVGNETGTDCAGAVFLDPLCDDVAVHSVFLCCPCGVGFSTGYAGTVTKSRHPVKNRSFLATLDPSGYDAGVHQTEQAPSRVTC